MTHDQLDQIDAALDELVQSIETPQLAGLNTQARLALLDDDPDRWWSLSTGERALLSMADQLGQIADQLSHVDQRRQHQIRSVLELMAGLMLVNT